MYIMYCTISRPLLVYNIGLWIDSCTLYMDVKEAKDSTDTRLLIE